MGDVVLKFHIFSVEPKGLRLDLSKHFKLFHKKLNKGRFSPLEAPFCGQNGAFKKKDLKGFIPLARISGVTRFWVFFNFSRRKLENQIASRERKPALLDRINRIDWFFYLSPQLMKW